jgi:spermidine synthase
MSWHEETLYPDVREALKIDEELYRGRTAFQDVCFFRNGAMGTVMTLDGVVQTTEADEFIYHEMLVHPPLLAHGEARRVLVIGGGDGGCAREVLRHPIERLVMVELDGEVVELSKRFLPGLSDGAFDDKRLQLVIGDGAEFVARSEESFDVIIVDSTDPVGPGLVLFQEPFYEHCRRLLGGRGILVSQNGVPFFQRGEYDSTGATRARLFRFSGFYFVGVPTYFGGAMALGWGSDALDLPRRDAGAIDERYRDWGQVPRFYNPVIHQAALAVPNYLKAGGPRAGSRYQ